MNATTATYGFKVLGKSAVNRLKRRLNMPFKPILLNFIVTYKCNARCRMCNIWQKYLNDDRSAEEMTAAQIRDAFEANKDYLSGLMHIGLTGGEPFLRDDLVDIVRSIREVFPACATGPQTNGLMTDVVLAGIKEMQEFYPQISMAVSLDGIGRTHDRVRGVNGAFDRAMETIKGAREIGVSRITSGMTLSESNCTEIAKVRDTVENCGAEFSCFLIDNSDYFGNRGSAYDLSGEAKVEIINSLKEFSHHYYMDNLRRQLDGTRTPQVRCYAGRTQYVMDPYGDIKPCILRPEVFGNILRTPLKEMLESKEAHELRRNLNNCRCWSQCEVSSSILADALDVLYWFPKCGDKRKFFDKLDQVRRSL